MNKGLAISFFALLYFDTAGAPMCWKCQKVAKDNSCTHKEDTCKTRLWRFCYSRKTSKGAVLKVDRGCSPVCRSIKNSKTQLDEEMLCCVRNLCNTHNFWANE